MKKIVDIASVITGFAAVVALVISIYTNKRTNSTSKTDFLLNLKELFNSDSKKRIHIELREGKDVSSWVDLDDYLGLFEICKMMIDEKTISIKSFSHLYAYRLNNIFMNDKIVLYKLVMEFESWKNLIELYEKIFPKLKKNMKTFKEVSKKMFDKYSVEFGKNQDDMKIDESDHRELIAIRDNIRSFLIELN
jgi:hypothetical protein